MSKFDEVITVKLGQLSEATFPPTTSASSGQSGANLQSTANTQSTTSATNTTNPQNSVNPSNTADTTKTTNTTNNQPTNQQPEQMLAGLFQKINWADSNAATTVLNNALKAAGSVPGISDFFSKATYNPQTGFSIAQVQQPQQAR